VQLISVQPEGKGNVVDQENRLNYCVLTRKQLPRTNYFTKCKFADLIAKDLHNMQILLQIFSFFLLYVNTGLLQKFFLFIFEAC